MKSIYFDADTMTANRRDAIHRVLSTNHASSANGNKWVPYRSRDVLHTSPQQTITSPQQVITSPRRMQCVSTHRRRHFLLSFFLFFLYSFTSTAQTFTQITLPYTGTCELTAEKDKAYFKVTINTEAHLYFQLNDFGGHSSGNVSYTLYEDEDMTKRVTGGQPGYGYREYYVVTAKLSPGTYYLQWSAAGYIPPPFSWSMETIEPAKIKEFRDIDYTTSLILGKNTGTLKREANMVYIDSEYAGEEEDRRGGIDVSLAKGFAFKAEGGKVYKITMQARRLTTGYNYLGITFLTGGTLTTAMKDIRGQVGDEFSGTTLSSTGYFMPTKTEELRALLNYNNINHEVDYFIQIEEAIPEEQNTTITFEEIDLPHEQIITFEANNSTYYNGEYFKGYTFTLPADATVYFYGNNTFYTHEPSMSISQQPFRADQMDSRMSLSPQQLSAGTYYVAFIDRGFFRDDYFTTRLKISTTEGSPVGNSPTVRPYPLTPLVTLLDNAEEVTALPYSTFGTFDQSTSALVPTHEALNFRPGSNVGTYFSLAKKITITEGEPIEIRLKYWGKKNPAIGPNEPMPNINPRLVVYQKNEESYQPYREDYESMRLYAPGTYYIVATCMQSFDQGDYQLQIYHPSNPVPQPVLNNITITPSTIDIVSSTTALEKELLLTQLTVKGTTGDNQTFTLPNALSFWNITGNTATYTPQESSDYVVQPGTTGTVTFHVITATYTVTFLPNGGIGTMPPQTIAAGQSLSPNSFTNGNKTFNYWTTSQDGSGTKYANGQVVTLTGNLTLYAQWMESVILPTITLGAVTNITARTAQLNATITLGTVPPSEYGFIFYGGNRDEKIPVVPQDNKLTWLATGLDEDRGYEVNSYYIYNGITYRSFDFTYFRTLQATTYITNLWHSNVTSTSAILSVEIVEGTEEQVLSRKFQYRESYFGEWINVPGGTGTSTFTATVTGLTPETWYEYRAVITVTGGVEKPSSNQDFFTLAAGATPATATTLAASNINKTSATLNATVDAGSQYINSSGFEYRKVGESYWNYIATTGTTTLTATVTGLRAGTEYEFKIIIRADGNRLEGNTLTFTTLSDGSATVTTAAATAITQTSATLNGTVNAGTQTVTDRKFEYRVTGGTWSTISATGTTTVSANVTGLTAATNYEFRAVITADGVTKNGNTLTFTTPAVGVIQATVTTAVATVVTQTSATLNGTVNAGTQTVTDRKFEYRVTGGTWNTVAATGTTTVSANVTGLTAATNYEFKLVITADGTRKESTVRAFRTPSENYVKQTVTAGTITAITKNSATLSGTITAGSEPVTARGFEYKAKSAGTWQQISQSSDGNITTTVDGLTANTEYEVRVYATTGVETITSSVVTFTTEKDVTGITKENLVLTLYPNPVVTVLNISNIGLTEASTISIFDIAGKLVLQVPAAEVVDVSSLPQGFYTVKAGKYTAKMMKQ